MNLGTGSANINTTNLADGKPIYYFKNISNRLFGVTENMGAFYCYNCSNITVLGQNFQNSGAGLSLYNVTNSNFININYPSDYLAMVLYESSGNTFRNNAISNNFQNFLIGNSANSFNNSIDTSNTIDGKPIYYLNGASNETITGVNLGMFHCRNCNNVTLNNSGLQYGTTNSESGEELFYVGNSNNITIDGNDLGVQGQIYQSDVVLFRNNTVTGNYSLQVIQPTNSVFYHNNFLQSFYCYSCDSTNSFNEPLPVGGNYWMNSSCPDLNSDNICDSAYISGDITDNFPWKYENAWLGIQPTIDLLEQYKSDGSTLIAEADITTETTSLTPESSTVTFKAKVTDPNSAQVRLEVEVKPFSESFNGLNTVISSPVSPGSIASVQKNGLISGSYQWRARAINSSNIPSDWIEFGTGTAQDFTVKLVPLYTQASSNYPSKQLTDTWFNEPYARGSGIGAFVDYKFSLITSDNYSIVIHGEDDNAANGAKSSVVVKVYLPDPNNPNRPDKNNLIVQKNISWPYGDNQRRSIVASLGNLTARNYIIRIQSTKDYFDKGNASDSGDLNVYLDWIRVNNSNGQQVFFTEAENVDSSVRVKTVGGDIANGLLRLFGYECGSTIGQCGCYISSIVMVLNYYGITQDVNQNAVNPKNLNEWVTEKGYYGVAGDLNAVAVIKEYTKDAFGQSRAELVKRKEYASVTQSSKDELNSYLEVDPVIISVKGTSHFIVATSELSSTYSVVDPWWYKTRKLAQSVSDSATETNYANIFNGIRVLGNNVAGVDHIEINIASPAELLVIDPDGLRIGKDPISNTDYNEVTDGEYFKETIKLPNDDTPVEHYTKKLYIPNPKNGDYNVKVIGTGDGSYTLTATTSASNNIYKKVFEGNTINGLVADYGLIFDSLNPQNVLFDVQDKIVPTVAINITGIQNPDNWFTSGTIVTLSSEDNAGGVGVYKTEYSLDGGNRWEIYTDPFSPPDGLAVNILYRAEDYVGNVSGSGSQTIKVDQTPPEAKIFFDPATRFLKVEGMDNLGATTVTKINDENYTIIDHLGHALKLNIDPTYIGSNLNLLSSSVIDQSSILNLRILGLQYDNSSVITPELNHLHYEWNNVIVNGVSKIKNLNELLTINLLEVLTGIYNHIDNQTLITKFENGSPSIETLNGLRIIKLKTNNGVLEYEY